jgi:hypothetical protein
VIVWSPAGIRFDEPDCALHWNGIVAGLVGSAGGGDQDVEHLGHRRLGRRTSDHREITAIGRVTFRHVRHDDAPRGGNPSPRRRLPNRRQSAAIQAHTAE